MNGSSNRGLRRLIPRLAPAEKKTLTAANTVLGVGAGVAQLVGPFAHNGLALLVITLVVALVGTSLLVIIARAVDRRHQVRAKTVFWALALLLIGGCAGGAIGYFASSAATGEPTVSSAPRTAPPHLSRAP